MAKHASPIHDLLSSGETEQLKRALDQIGGDKGRAFNARLAERSIADLLDCASDPDLQARSFYDDVFREEVMDRLYLSIARIGDDGMERIINEIHDPSNHRVAEIVTAIRGIFDQMVPPYAESDYGPAKWCRIQHELGLPVPNPHPEINFSDACLDQLGLALKRCYQAAPAGGDVLATHAMSSLKEYREARRYFA